jgi:hypothetical protein
MVGYWNKETSRFALRPAGTVEKVVILSAVKPLCKAAELGWSTLNETLANDSSHLRIYQKDTRGRCGLEFPMACTETHCDQHCLKVLGAMVSSKGITAAAPLYGHGDYQ